MLLMGKVVHRVVGGAENRHVHLFQKVPYGKGLFLKLFIACCEDCRGCFSGKQLVDAEIPFQLKMGPVIERITHGLGQWSAPIG